MNNDCWTLRYEKTRLPREPIRLKPPLERVWRFAHEKGGTYGWIRAGDGGVFTATGLGFTTRLDLRTGRVIWMDRLALEKDAEEIWKYPERDQRASLFTKWDSKLVVFGGKCVRTLDFNSGREHSVRECPQGLGLEDSFIIGDILVGHVAKEFHAIDLNTLKPLWSVPELISNPLVSDGEVVIRAQDEVTCFDLKTGAVRWNRPKTDFAHRAYFCGCVWDGQFIIMIDASLVSFDLATGATRWQWPLPDAIHSWFPYDGRIYAFVGIDGMYAIIDMRNGQLLFEKKFGYTVPALPRKKMSGLVSHVRGKPQNAWRSTGVMVSETHAFLVNGGSGQIVVLARDTGDVEQIVDLGAMPCSEEVIYENHLLFTGFDAAVHCFKGAE